MRGKKSMDHEDAVNELFVAQNGADAERYLKRAGMHVPCGPSMMDYPETCWKPPETVAVVRQFSEVVTHFVK